MKTYQKILITISVILFIFPFIIINPYLWRCSFGLITVDTWGYYVFIPFIISCFSFMLFCQTKINEFKKTVIKHI